MQMYVASCINGFPNKIIILPKNQTTLQKRKKSSTFASKIFKIMGRHRKFDASFKSKVAIAALQEKESLNSLAMSGYAGVLACF